MKVNLKFWVVKRAYEWAMIQVLIESWKRAPINPKTGKRVGQLPMNINYN